jgi:hypothetical protein
MKCSKCGQNTADDKKTCIYCGVSIDEQASSQKKITKTDDTKAFSYIEETDKIDLSDLPDNKKPKIENTSHKKPKKLTTYEETTKRDYLLEDDGWVENRTEMTLDNALNLLTGLKDSLKSNQIKIVDYEKLVLDIIEDYTLPMDDKAKINFAANGIMDSELYEYLNDTILKNLRSFIITHVSNK